MLLDAYTEFADAVAVASAAGTNIIGDVIDLSTVHDLGEGKPMWLVIQVTTAFSGGTSFQFILASDNGAAIATNGAETRHLLTDVFLVAELTQGFYLGLPLPTGDVSGGITPYERYLGVLGVGVGGSHVGSINAFLTISAPPSQRTYDDGPN